MDDDRLAYAAHFGDEDEDEESSSGHSDLDEEYERYRPGPVDISPSKLVEICASGVELVKDLQSNLKKKKRKRKKKKMAEQAKDIEPTVVLPTRRLAVDEEFQIAKNKSKNIPIGEKFTPLVKNAFDALAMDEETTVYVSDEETEATRKSLCNAIDSKKKKIVDNPTQEILLEEHANSIKKKSVDSKTEKPDKEEISDVKKKKRRKIKKKSDKVDEVEQIPIFTSESPFVEDKFQTTKNKGKQVQMDQTFTPPVKNSFDALAFDRDTSIYVSDIEDVEVELKIGTTNEKTDIVTAMAPEGKITKNRYKKRLNLKTTNKINITHYIKFCQLFNINRCNFDGIVDNTIKQFNYNAIKNMFLIDDINEYPVWISEELPEDILEFITFLQYLNFEEKVVMELS